MFIKKLIRFRTTKQLEHLGFEPDGFIEVALNNGFEMWLDIETGDVLALYQPNMSGQK